jgi:hypothetical protein
MEGGGLGKEEGRRVEWGKAGGGQGRGGRQGKRMGEGL